MNRLAPWLIAFALLGAAGPASAIRSDLSRPDLGFEASCPGTWTSEEDRGVFAFVCTPGDGPQVEVRVSPRWGIGINRAKKYAERGREALVDRYGEVELETWTKVDAPVPGASVHVRYSVPGEGGRRPYFARAVLKGRAWSIRGFGVDGAPSPAFDAVVSSFRLVAEPAARTWLYITGFVMLLLGVGGTILIRRGAS
jgi:hypothetical protein